MKIYRLISLVLASFFILGCSGVTYEREYSVQNGLREGTATER